MKYDYHSVDPWYIAHILQMNVGSMIVLLRLHLAPVTRFYKTMTPALRLRDVPAQPQPSVKWTIPCMKTPFHLAEPWWVTVISLLIAWGTLARSNLILWLKSWASDLSSGSFRLEIGLIYQCVAPCIKYGSLDIILSLLVPIRLLTLKKKRL